MPLFNQEKLELIELVNQGDLAIIPIGFRCYTVENIRKKLGVTQVSLPFNNGFFTANAIASVFEEPTIKLQFDDGGTTHQVCIKTENHQHTDFGTGISFRTSSYEEISAAVTSKNIEGIDQYLDTTYGYYTLDTKHQFILAHYNWHEFALTAPKTTVNNRSQILQKLNEILNKRVQRMLKLCQQAKYILFIFEETQGYQYLQIDNSIYPLHDFQRLEQVLNKQFSDRFSIINLSDINNVTDVFQLLAENKIKFDKGE